MIRPTASPELCPARNTFVGAENTRGSVVAFITFGQAPEAVRNLSQHSVLYTVSQQNPTT